MSKMVCDGCGQGDLFHSVARCWGCELAAKYDCRCTGGRSEFLTERVPVERQEREATSHAS